MTVTDERLVREQAFHDERFGGESRPADRFYAINRASDGFFRATLAALPAGTRLLDYGCGDGAYAAIEAALHGHQVTAIDLSPVAIDQARTRAAAAGVADRIDFQVMNAEALELPDASFDFVCGLGVVHHLDLAASLDEVARVLAPDGAGLLLEPLGHNPLINAYRNRTPAQRTIDEHPLMMADLEIFRERFNHVSERYFHLLALAAVPLRRRGSFDRVLRVLDAADRGLLRGPMRRHAWLIGLELAGPRRSSLPSEGSKR